MTRDVFLEFLKEKKITFEEFVEKLKRKLLPLANCVESLAEECALEAIARFYERFNGINRKLITDIENIEGYIFTMAKFECLRNIKGRNKNIDIDPVSPKMNIDSEDNVKSEQEHIEEQEMEELEKEAIKIAIPKLSENCQMLFATIKEYETDKPSRLFELLGFENPRKVTVLKHDCEKRLKVLATVEFENLKKNKGNGNQNK